MTVALTKVWLLETIWTDCPEEVRECVADFWRYQEFGNNDYYWSGTILDLHVMNNDPDPEDPEFEVDPEGYPMISKWDRSHCDYVETRLDLTPLIEYLKAQGIGIQEKVLVHYWW